MTSVLIVEWKTILLPSSRPPGYSSVGQNGHEESWYIIYSCMSSENKKEGEGRKDTGCPLRDLRNAKGGGEKKMA